MHATAYKASRNARKVPPFHHSNFETLKIMYFVTTQNDHPRCEYPAFSFFLPSKNSFVEPEHLNKKLISF